MNLMPFIACLVLTVSCKKGGNDNAIKVNRIAAVKTSNFNHLYRYDEQNRLTGIDYSVSSHMNVSYSASGIVLQWNDGAGNPTDYRMELNIVDGRAISVKESNTNYRSDHFYSYDSEGKMIQAQVTRTALSNNQVENRGVAVMNWDGNLLQRVLLQVSNRLGEKTDSIIYNFTYYNDIKFITWDDAGFSYFGKMPIGGFSNGFGWRLPINFLSEDMMPSVAAMKETSRKSYYRNGGPWSLSQGSTTYPETDYQHDQQGRLNKWRTGIEITWK
jgi:hypothetical protein